MQEARDAREAIVGSFDVLIARGGHRTNEIMKVLTLTSVILLPGALIAGVMGMNFKVGLFDEPCFLGGRGGDRRDRAGHLRPREAAELDLGQLRFGTRAGFREQPNGGIEMDTSVIVILVIAVLIVLAIARVRHATTAGAAGSRNGVRRRRARARKPERPSGVPSRPACRPRSRRSARSASRPPPQDLQRKADELDPDVDDEANEDVRKDATG